MFQSSFGIQLKQNNKMDIKTIATAAVILLYIIISAICWSSEKPANMRTNCGYRKPCIRFCCNEIEGNCKETVQKFNISAFPTPSYFDEDDKKARNFTFMYGKPSCGLQLFKSTTWKFDSVSFPINFCRKLNN